MRHNSDCFSVNGRVRRARVAASDLFNCIIDHLMDRVCAWIPGYVQEATSSDFWNMQITLRYCTQRRPKDLPGRSKNPSASEEVLPQLQMHGEDVESVTSFTHLGSTITNDANPTPEINRRCPLVARCHANSPGATVATSLHLQSNKTDL